LSKANVGTFLKCLCVYNYKYNVLTRKSSDCTIQPPRSYCASPDSKGSRRRKKEVKSLCVKSVVGLKF